MESTSSCFSMIVCLAARASSSLSSISSKCNERNSESRVQSYSSNLCIRWLISSLSGDPSSSVNRASSVVMDQQIIPLFLRMLEISLIMLSLVVK